MPDTTLRKTMSSIDVKEKPWIHHSNTSMPIIHTSRQNDQVLATKLKDITACNMESLLSLETQTRLDHQQEHSNITPKPTKIKFDLPPIPPPRAKNSPSKRRWSSPETHAKQTNKFSRWSIKLLSVKHQHPSDIVIGSKVKLVKRPLPIIGTVKYIGKVHFDDDDEWLGIELDTRIGNTDGAIDGIRYFQTNPHGGIFTRKQDTIKLQ